MRLGPDEVGLGEADFVEAFELFEADGEELGGLGRGDEPLGGRGEEALAVAAEGDRGCKPKMSDGQYLAIET